MFNQSRAIVTAAAFAAAAFSQNATAIPFTVTAWAPAGFAPVNISKTDPTTRNYNGYGGGFVMTNQTPGVVESFISWCVDIFQYIPGATGGNYTVNVGAANLSAAVRNDLGRLATLALTTATTPGSGSGSNAAAFQLAVWEILYDRSGTYNLATGTFISNNQGSNTAFNTANGWLGTLNSNPGMTSTYTMNTYVSGTFQDQITFVPTSVSEPSMLALLGVGLFGFAFARRKASMPAANA